MFGFMVVFIFLYHKLILFSHIASTIKGQSFDAFRLKHWIYLILELFIGLVGLVLKENV